MESVCQCSVAGNWVFRGRRWLRPDIPEDRHKLEAGYNQLCAQFPVAQICSKDNFINTLGSISSSWVSRLSVANSSNLMTVCTAALPTCTNSPQSSRAGAAWHEDGEADDKIHFRDCEISPFELSERPRSPTAVAAGPIAVPPHNQCSLGWKTSSEADSDSGNMAWTAGDRADRKTEQLNAGESMDLLLLDRDGLPLRQACEDELEAFGRSQSF